MILTSEAIGDDYCSWFYPLLDVLFECGLGTIWYGDNKDTRLFIRSSREFNPTKEPTIFLQVSHLVFAFVKKAFINFHHATFSTNLTGVLLNE